MHGTMLKWALRTVALYAVAGLSLAAGYGHGDRLLGFVDGTADGDASRLAAAGTR